MKRSLLKRHPYRNPFFILMISLAISLIGLALTITSPARADSAAESQQTTAQESRQTDVRELKMGEPIEREMGGGEVHSYRVVLTAGQYMHVVVEQKGIDVVVRLFGPDGKQITEVDNPTGTQLPELVSLVAEVAGEYRLEVKPFDDPTPAAKYEIKVEELREATARDRERVVAERRLAEAEVLNTQGTAESLPRALGKYKEALSLWHKIGDRQREALTLNRIGIIYWRLGENHQALEYYNQALPLRRAVGDRLGEASTVHNIGVVYWRLGESQRALEYYNRALLLRRAIGDRQDLAFSFYAVGQAYNDLGKFPEALEFYTHSLALFRATGNRRGEANLLANIGVVHHNLGDWQKALDYYHQALSLSRSLKIHSTEANMLNSIGVLYWQLGESQKALEYYNQALSARSGERLGEFTTLLAIGTAYESLGDLQKALDYLNHALLLTRALGDRRSEASTLREIGAVYNSSGERQKAIDLYNQALLLQRAVADRQGEALTLSNIGVSYSSLGKPEKALEYLSQALVLHRAVGNRDGEASTLRHIARAERDRGRLAEACTQIEAALNIIERTRSQFVSQALRTSFSASRQEFYELYIDLLMRLHRNQPSAGYDATALQTSERGRARSLLDILTEARADIRQGVDPVLLERERSLRQQLNAKSERLTRLLSGKHTDEQERAARKEVEALLTDHQEVRVEIRAKSPRYAALTQPQPLSPKEIQGLLDKDTLLLEYALGEEQSYLWAVTPTSIRSFELPKRADIEAAATRVYEMVTARNKLVRFETPETKQARVTQADLAYVAESRALSQTLLGPVAGLLGRKRLLIVNDGALQYLPFGALPIPIEPLSGVKKLNQSARYYQPMMISHEIVSLPSASTLAVLRKEMNGKQRGSKTVAVLADPVFQNDDPRVIKEPIKPALEKRNSSSNSSGTREPMSEIERSARDTGDVEFRRLIFSRQEARAITALSPSLSSKAMVDFEASRMSATSPDLSDYRIIHFATHSLINSQHPDLSGIVLSLVDKAGEPQDGFLRLHEIYNLKLGADLVVLSACRTALGKEVKGEGLVGVTRGFMYAGTPRVVASLWAIDDQITAELMKSFYREMLIKKQRPAAALRSAQVDIWRQKRLPPYYWAAFVLQGEWK